MRAGAATVLLVASAVSALGCIGKDPADPSDFASPSAEEREVARAKPGDPRRTIRAECDKDGNLHVRAPDGAKVTTPADAGENAVAEITLDEAPGRRLRRTKSLGFIGDGKLGPSRSHGGPWNAPDGLLPPHAHGQRGWGSYGYRSYRPSWGSYGYPPPPQAYGYGGSSYAPPPPMPPAYWR
jgi:hypothetical protein